MPPGGAPESKNEEDEHLDSYQFLTVPCFGILKIWRQSCLISRDSIEDVLSFLCLISLSYVIIEFGDTWDSFGVFWRIFKQIDGWYRLALRTVLWTLYLEVLEESTVAKWEDKVMKDARSSVEG